jgi:hypothetical protein
MEIEHGADCLFCSTATVDVISTAMLVVTFAFFSVSGFDGFHTDSQTA